MSKLWVVFSGKRGVMLFDDYACSPYQLNDDGTFSPCTIENKELSTVWMIDTTSSYMTFSRFIDMTSRKLFMRVNSTDDMFLTYIKTSKPHLITADHTTIVVTNELASKPMEYINIINGNNEIIPITVGQAISDSTCIAGLALRNMMTKVGLLYACMIVYHNA